MTIAEFDHLPETGKRELLKQCCGSEQWVNNMLTIFPVEDLVELLEAAEEKWYTLNAEDWKQAFENHPKIGDVSSLHKKFSDTAALASKEQSGVDTADDITLQQLASENKIYQDKHGFIFIVCATGKSAKEMLSILHTRSKNNSAVEIEVAAGEQLKITRLRLEKLFGINENVNAHE